ncbi:hypothetical protein M413DRAFT_430813 [Hebeloma cylindrosporum]|uniref:Uncharacterized protein n=1 Tax=Hebeloma cylindrosporum TaxID=76867 RepID=A0A0C3BVN0_HEBCY|nr:hypothetical protein M413DRAFT_430813 [Hebeloma cylindrosporum h7]
MLRIAALLRRAFSGRNPSKPPVSSITEKPTNFNPEDWYIVETSPGGNERNFANSKTGEVTWYTPEGMTAEEILAIPDANKYWWTVKDVKRYMKEMAKQKARNGGRDWKDAK